MYKVLALCTSLHFHGEFHGFLGDPPRVATYLARPQWPQFQSILIWRVSVSKKIGKWEAMEER